LAVGSAAPNMNMPQLALLLCLQLGIMGIITPYGTGPSPVYYGSGHLPAADYWRLGAIFGFIVFFVFMGLTGALPLARGCAWNARISRRGLQRKREHNVINRISYGT